MENYEKLGLFYLGKTADPRTGKPLDDLVLYDAKDLTTHAVIIGMTGSGKTGLAVGLLEEALIDNIPVIAVDPKGDLPNLMLRFPNLRPEDFRPWINTQDALAKGRTPEQHADDEAKKWGRGLAEWHQSPERIARFVRSGDITVYTPGSSAGRPVSVLRSFDPPPDAILEDGDLMTERIQTTTSGLLALLGVDADPIASREHILMANIFETAWRAGQKLDLASLIRAIQSPPFQRIGVMDLEMIYPAKDRFALAMRLNNLLAAPGFEAWMEGDALDIGRLLHDDRGRPRASIFSISHLPDDQRMFFVTRLLNELLGWLRTQPGTGSLRAIFYMDEVFGYFPPVQSPPSKAPMLTLLKQARAFGLGLVLATQNPVDLDYKGLSNTGTWFIGRLQTERDKERVLDGLEGAAPGGGFDRQALGEVISGLGQRVFLLHNVHETGPRIFQTRWTLSYLSGPMTREQIKKLDTLHSGTAEPAATPPPPPLPQAAPATGASSSTPSLPPVSPPGVKAGFLAASGAGQGLMYIPTVLGRVEAHYVSAKYGINESTAISLFTEIADGAVPVDWDQAVTIDFDPLDLTADPLPGADFAELPAAAQTSGAYTKWGKDLVKWIRQNRPLELFRSKGFKLAGMPGETEGQFRGRLGLHLREQRDLAAEKLRRKYAKQFQTLNDRLMRAEQAVEREKEQAKAQKIETAISFGSALLGAFLGRKAVSVGTTRRVGSAMKSAGRIRKERMDVERAEETVAATRERLQSLEARFQEDLSALDLSFDASTAALETVRIFPKTADLHLELFALVWLPYRRDASGRMTPDWR